MSRLQQSRRHQACKNFTSTDLHLSYGNQGAAKLAHNHVFHAMIKQIKTKHHFVRKQVLEGEIALDSLHIEENPVDILT